MKMIINFKIKPIALSFRQQRSKRAASQESKNMKKSHFVRIVGTPTAVIQPRPKG